MFLNDDDMVECPYNKTHRMLRKRLQSHLLKCRLNYPDVELRKCPFNITHLIPEPEFTHHATNCPDRKLITQYKYDAPEPKDEEGPKHAPIECDEDWDDTDVNDYNPQLYLEKSNVIRKPNGSNPSERKLFIKKERKRLGDRDDSSDDETENSNDGSSNQRSSETVGRNDFNNFFSLAASSSYLKQRSRSPVNQTKRDRSRSPVGYRRSYKDHSPPGRSSPNYSRRSPQPNAGRHVLNSHNPDNDSSTYYDRNTGTNFVMPEAPPPPMISYPSRRSYLTNKQQSSNNQ